jgi:hypothetical protein
MLACAVEVAGFDKVDLREVQVVREQRHLEAEMVL